MALDVNTMYVQEHIGDWPARPIITEHVVEPTCIWRVRSYRNGVLLGTYTVKQYERKWACSCTLLRVGGECPHITAVKEGL